MLYTKQGKGPCLKNRSLSWGVKAGTGEPEKPLGWGEGLARVRTQKAPVRSQGMPRAAAQGTSPGYDVKHLNGKDKELEWDVLLSVAWERPRGLRVPGRERHKQLLQSWLFHCLDP